MNKQTEMQMVAVIVLDCVRQCNALNLNKTDYTREFVRMASERGVSDAAKALRLIMELAD